MWELRRGRLLRLTAAPARLKKSWVAFSAPPPRPRARGVLLSFRRQRKCVAIVGWRQWQSERQHPQLDRKAREQHHHAQLDRKALEVDLRRRLGAAGAPGAENAATFFSRHRGRGGGGGGGGWHLAHADQLGFGAIDFMVAETLTFGLIHRFEPRRLAERDERRHKLRRRAAIHMREGIKVITCLGKDL